MTKAIRSILIIGTQRSGSNLLRIMLDQLCEVEAPHPPHLLQVFFPLLAFYGDLNDDKNFKTLIDDVCRFTEVNPVPWSGMNFDRNEIFNRSKKRSLVEIFKIVYEIKAEIKGADYWCCKSMANLYYIPLIESENIHPFYIHLIRDGRDVAASFQRAIVGEKHIYFLAKQWQKDQELSANATHHLSDAKTATLYYEKFIDDPEKALAPILNKLGLKWKNEMLNFYTSEEAIHTAAAGQMWKNVAHPVDRTNKKHYSEKLTAKEIELFERVAGKTLIQFGYETKYELNGTPFTHEEIESFSAENEKLKKQMKAVLTQDAGVRIPQENIIKEIKSRVHKN